MIKFLCWLKVNSLALKISQALIDKEISHEELEKDKYEMKKNLRSENEKQEITRFHSLKSGLKKWVIDNLTQLMILIG